MVSCQCDDHELHVLCVTASPHEGGEGKGKHWLSLLGQGRGPRQQDRGQLELNNNNNNKNNNNHIQRCSSRFFTMCSLHRKLSPTRMLEWPGRSRVQITCNTLGAYHVQHVMLCATWYESESNRV